MTLLGEAFLGAVKLNEAQFRALYPTGNATHAWSPKKGVYYDASNPTNLASSANRGTAKTNNARIMASGSVKTTKNIKAGAEIFLPYGGSFQQIKEAQSSSDRAMVTRAATMLYLSEVYYR